MQAEARRMNTMMICTLQGWFCFGSKGDNRGVSLRSGLSGLEFNRVSKPPDLVLVYGGRDSGLRFQDLGVSS